MKKIINCPERFNCFVDCMGGDLSECIELAHKCKDLVIFAASLPYPHPDSASFYVWAMNL